MSNRNVGGNPRRWESLKPREEGASGGGRDQLYQVVLNLISQVLLCPQLLFPSPVRQELQCPLPRGGMKMKSCSAS